MPVPELEWAPAPTTPGQERALLPGNQEWRLDAACGYVDTAVFFPETVDQAERAKAVCAPCPVREDCLKFALVTRQDDGVWGGLDENERRRIRRRGWESSRRPAKPEKPQKLKRP